MKICNRCLEKNPADAIDCRRCGQPLDRNMLRQQPSRKAHNRLSTTIFAITICYTAFFMIMIFFWIVNPLGEETNVEKENFTEFAHRFGADSVFQSERINFPLSVEQQMDDDNLTGWEIEKDEYEKLTILAAADGDSWKINEGENESIVSKYCECGTIDTYIFTIKNNKWYLKKRFIDSRQSKDENGEEYHESTRSQSHPRGLKLIK